MLQKIKQDVRERINESINPWLIDTVNYILDNSSTIEEFVERFFKTEDNFALFSIHKIIDSSFINKYQDVFNPLEIYCNQNTDNGYVYLNKSKRTFECNNSNVFVFHSCRVDVIDCEVRAYDNSVVRAFGDSQVILGGNAFCIAHDETEVQAFGNSHVVGHDFTRITSREGTKVELHEEARNEYVG
jgi:hypothetical protein